MESGLLVINAGSSSIKFAGYADRGGDDLAFLGKGQVEGLKTEPRFVCKDAAGDTVGEHRWSGAIKHAEAIDYIIGWIEENATDLRVTAAGHRVVFGGTEYTVPTRLDDRVIADIETLVPFFPLHLPHNLAAIRALTEAHPDLPQVACFDNSFHRTLPQVARWFALPRRLFDEGVRRYGFHGLSYEFIAHVLPDYAPEARRVVVAHLGSGASLSALRDGESVETTLGFSGLDGLPMGTRPGALDPGVLLYLLQAGDMDVAALEKLLYTESGLLGVSGISNDMRDLLASDDPRAVEAIDLFVYHIGKHLGALAAVLGGLDALVFTAGIGEHAPLIRERVCRQAEWLGVQLDPAANRAGGPRITTADSPVSAWVIPTDEERMIAMHTRRVLQG
ncbi:MAG: acetate/propionate family kinase [Rhodospirillales bacterium]|nr:MAG: acetate/propionate family kinase [Rhodospirillales bacterium]